MSSNEQLFFVRGEADSPLTYFAAGVAGAGLGEAAGAVVAVELEPLLEEAGLDEEVLSDFDSEDFGLALP